MGHRKNRRRKRKGGRRWTDKHLVHRNLRDPRYCTASAEMIIFHLRDDGTVEIVGGVRHHRKKRRQWAGYWEEGCAGFVDRTDLSTLHAAVWEAWEECGLIVEPWCWVGDYGPESRLHSVAELDHREEVTGFRVIATPRHAQSMPVVHKVFAGLAVGGELRDTNERSENQWIPVHKFVGRYGRRIAFDGARFLYRLMEIIRAPEDSVTRVTATHAIKNFPWDRRARKPR